MSTPAELRETARQFRQTATAIYQSEKRELYGEALNHLYEATRRDLYANLLEGKEKELERCIELNPKPPKREQSEEISTRDVRGRYNLFSTSYREMKEQAEIQRHQKKKRKEEREEKREGFKELPAQFSFKL